MSPRGRVSKTRAIILRRSDLGEADRLVTLLTEDYGKIRAVAKGVRKPTAKSAGHVELYTLAEVMLSKGRDLYVITQAELLEPFLPLQGDLHRIGYASLFAELVDRFAVDEMEIPEAFELLVNGLYWLSEPQIDLRLVSRYYEMHILNSMGYAPTFFTCAIGGERLKAEDQFYSVIEGGMVCQEHAAGHVNMTPVPLPVFKVLRHMMRSEWETIKVLNIGPLIHHDLQRILHNTIIFLLEKRLQSVDFLRRVAELEERQTSVQEEDLGLD